MGVDARTQRLLASVIFMLSDRRFQLYGEVGYIAARARLYWNPKRTQQRLYREQCIWL
jgi:hypothetical protein